MMHWSMRSVLGWAVLASLLALAVLAVDAAPALAQASDVGRNVETWAKALLLGVVALVAIPAIAKRDVTGGLMLALLAVIVGGFAFAPETVKSVISGIWRSIAG
jgi:hypothetical protein